MVHCIYLGSTGYDFQKNIVFFCLKIFFTYTNSVDPDEMQHYAAFYLGLHCSQNYSYRGFPEYKGLSAHAYVSGQTRGLNFGLCFHLHPYFVYKA